jgi:hypothetical protein
MQKERETSDGHEWDAEASFNASAVKCDKF